MPSSSSSSNRIIDNDCCPAKKKTRLLETTITAGNSSTLKKMNCYSTPQWLLHHNDGEMSDSPATLFGGGGGGGGGSGDNGRGEFKVRQDHDKLQRLLFSHGFRTTKMLSPHQAVSIYKDSCQTMNDINDNNEQYDAKIREGREFLLVCFGFHHKQEEIEKDYRLFVRDAYCIILFCQKMHQVFNFKSSKKNDTSDDSVDKDLKGLLNKIEQTCQLMKKIQQNDNDDDDDNDTVNVHVRGSISSYSSRSYAEERVDELIQLSTNIKGRQKHNSYRVEEWKKEYQRICVSNSTLSNAYITLLQSTHEMHIKDIFFKFSIQEQSKYERITIHLSNDDENNEGRCRQSDLFLFLPSLHTVVTKGPLHLVSNMIESFWSHVLRNGYFPTTRIKKALDSQLRQFFLSGIVTTTITANNPIRNATNLPLPLKANFNPTHPLSIYLHGKAGTGTFSIYLLSFRWQVFNVIRARYMRQRNNQFFINSYYLFVSY